MFFWRGGVGVIKLFGGMRCLGGSEMFPSDFVE